MFVVVWGKHDGKHLRLTGVPNVDKLTSTVQPLALASEKGSMKIRNKKKQNNTLWGFHSCSQTSCKLHGWPCFKKKQGFWRQHHYHRQCHVKRWESHHNWHVTCLWHGDYPKETSFLATKIVAREGNEINNDVGGKFRLRIQFKQIELGSYT